VKVAAAMSDIVKVQEPSSEKDKQSNKEDVNVPQNSKISSTDVELCRRQGDQFR